MKLHQMYKTKEGEGAECTKCGEWIQPDENAVKLVPSTVEESGKVSPNGKAIHGVLHNECFEEL